MLRATLLAALGAAGGAAAAAAPPNATTTPAPTSPFPPGCNTVVPGLVCENTTSLCACLPNPKAAGTKMCECVSKTCIAQTDEMADASGVKVQWDRLQKLLLNQSEGVLRATRTDLGDSTGCRAIKGAQYCLWLMGGWGQPIVGGACVPETCSAAEQVQLRRLVAAIYGLNQNLTHVKKSDPNYLHKIGIYDSLNQGSPSSVRCMDARGTTLTNRYGDDSKAQGVAALLCLILVASVASVAALTARDIFTQKAAPGDDPFAQKARLLSSTPPVAAGKELEMCAVPEKGSSDSLDKKGSSSGGSTGTRSSPDGTPGPSPNSANGGRTAVIDIPIDADASLIRGNPLRDGGKRSYSYGAAGPAPGADRAGDERPAPAAAAKALACLWPVARAFDAREHWSALMKVNKPKPTSFLHGLRVWSMAWVILGHTAFDPQIPGFDNPAEVTDVTMNFSFFFAYGFTAVDTFYFMSGFLSCYLLVARWPQTCLHPGKNGLRLVMVYLDRYMRLTPVYALMILCAAHLIQYLPAHGPLACLAHNGAILGDCHKNWWRNLLYTNTIRPHHPTPDCFGHTWYLGNDMLYVWFFTPLMILFIHLPKIAAAIVCTLLVVTLGYAVHYGGRDSLGHSLYYRPESRAAPYLWGILAAFILRHEVTSAWLVSFYKSARNRALAYLTAFGLLFGTLCWQWAYHRTGALAAGTTPIANIPTVQADAHHKWGTPEKHFETWCYYFWWGSGLLVLTSVWAQGHGGRVTRFLSHPVFEVLGRLTYGAYLAHPVMIMTIKLSLTVGALPHFSNYWLLSTWVAAAAGAFIAATLLFVFVERPVGILWELATAKNKRKKPASTGTTTV